MPHFYKYLFHFNIFTYHKDVLKKKIATPYFQHGSLKQQEILILLFRSWLLDPPW